MKKDDAGFLDFFEEEPIVDSGENEDELDEPSPMPDPQGDEPVDTLKTEEEQLEKPVVPNKTNQPVEDVETKRYEYWQAKHDKLQKEMEAIKTKADINQDYAPIAEYLYQNPQALLKLQEQLQESAPKSNAPQMPTAPEKPERPVNYSRYEAMQDPESASAKYDSALMNYNSDMLDYMNAKQLYNEKMQYEQMQQIAEKERLARKQEAFKAEVLSNGLRVEEFNDFVKKLQSEESMSPKNLIAYYKILAGTGITKQELQNTEFARQQARAKNNPTPVGGKGGDPAVTPSEEEAFNQDMLNWKR